MLLIMVHNCVLILSFLLSMPQRLEGLQQSQLVWIRPSFAIVLFTHHSRQIRLLLVHMVHPPNRGIIFGWLWHVMMRQEAKIGKYVAAGPSPHHIDLSMHLYRHPPANFSTIQSSSSAFWLLYLFVRILRVLLCGCLFLWHLKSQQCAKVAATTKLDLMMAVLKIKPPSPASTV